MAHPRYLIAPLGRLLAPSIALARPEIPRLAPTASQSIRCASTKTLTKEKKKKKARSTFKQYDVRLADQFSLIDAMQYIRAFEVGQNPTSAKYEMHIRLRTAKDGPLLRDRFRLPHPVKTDVRVCVIVDPNSQAGIEARSSGAVLVGEEDAFDQIREGVIKFDRCICHIDSLQKLNKSGMARILGPKGLMPSTKKGTVVAQVGSTVRSMVAGSEYKEKMGVVRMAIGQLGFTPEMMHKNIKVFMESIRKSMKQYDDKVTKEIHEVVLSSTRSPGFTLNGEFRGANSIPPQHLSGPL